MHTINTFLAKASAAGTTAIAKAKERRQELFEDERGSMSLEQIIWTVVLGGAAVIAAGIVVAAIVAKSGELNV